MYPKKKKNRKLVKPLLSNKSMSSEKKNLTKGTKISKKKKMRKNLVRF